MRFFLFKDGQQIGPLEEEAVRAGLLSGEYVEGTPALIEGETEWKILGAILRHRDEPPAQFAAISPSYTQPAMDAPVQIDSLILFGKVLPWLALVSSVALFLGGTIVLSGIASAVVIFETCRAGNINRRWAYTLCGLFPVIGVFTLILLRLKVDGILRDHGSKVPFLMDKVPRSVAYWIIGMLCVVGWDLRVFGVISSGLSGITTPSVRVEESLAKGCESMFTQDKQKLFDQIHPVGTAKSVVVHEVNVDAWKHGKDTNQEKDIVQFTVRYTLFWEGPITKDGYTKVESKYDAESRHWNSKILATNGSTNQDVQDGVVSFAVGFLKGYLDSQ